LYEFKTWNETGYPLSIFSNIKFEHSTSLSHTIKYTFINLLSILTYSLCLYSDNCNLIALSQSLLWHALRNEMIECFQNKMYQYTKRNSCNSKNQMQKVKHVTQSKTFFFWVAKTIFSVIQLVIQNGRFGLRFNHWLTSKHKGAGTRAFYILILTATDVKCQVAIVKWCTVLHLSRSLASKSLAS
jgi:hypothetical protein